jgi:RNA polymerase sigma-70 factor (ECF subfamily)
MDASTAIRPPMHPGTKAKDMEESALSFAAATVGVRSEEKASDEGLMAQVSKGSTGALVILFRRYARTVRAIAYRAVRDALEADDLVQDIFLVVHRDAKAFDPAKGAARAWIFRIAHRRAISRHRYLSARHFYRHVDLDNLTGELEDPKTTVQHGRSIQEMFGEADFDKGLAALSPNQRETLRLHFFEGYTFAEIAANLGQSRGNIKHHYFRGLEKLRKQLFAGKLQGNGAVW